MTMTNGDARSAAAGTGSLFDFGFTFPVDTESDVAVYIRDADGAITLKTLTTDYTVSLTNGGASGGTVTMLTAPAVGEYLTVLLAPPRTQLKDYKHANVFPSGETEKMGDKLTSIVKRLFDDELGRTLRMDPGGVVAASDPFEALGKRIANMADPVNPQDAATQAWVQAEIINAVLGGVGYTITAYMAGMLGAADAAAALTYLTMSSYMQAGVTAANLSALTTARGYSANVRSLLLAASSDAMLTVLGFTTYSKTLVNDSSSSEARTTLEVARDLQRHNLIVNGDFQVWQHGTTINAGTTPANNDDTYVCDQWILLSDGADRADIAKLTTGLPEGGKGGIVFDAQSAGAQRFGIFQPIEARVAQAMRGKTVSLGVHARGTGNLSSVSIALIEWTGTADSITSDAVNAWNSGGALPATYTASWVSNGFASLALTTSWQRLSLEGRTIGASANNLGFLIYVNDNGWNIGDTLELSCAHLVEGSFDVPFRSEPFEVAHDRASRFFTKTFELEDAPAQAAFDHGISVFSLPGIGPSALWTFPVPMRVSPTITNYAPGSGSGSQWNKLGGAGAGATNVASSVSEKDSKRALISGVDSDTGVNLYGIHATADARL